MRQIILDTETTGLDPREHRLIEVAGLEMVNRKLTGRHCHFYIHPQRDIDPDAQRVHGISLDMLEGKPVFKQVAGEIADFLRDAELIIHNAAFDIGFLDAEFERVRLPKTRSVAGGVIDTLAMAREVFPGKRNNLDALCDRFEIDRSNRTLHGALIDCELLAEVYLALTRGQESLEMAIETDSDSSNDLSLGARQPLIVQRASAAEQAGHEAMLARLDKKAGGACVWRDYEPLDAPAGADAS